MNTKLIVLAATVLGLAAQDPFRRITADVPFAFEANGVKLAAGTYMVKAPGSLGVVTVVEMATGRSIMLRAGGAERNPGRTNSLEFKRYGDAYFLSAVKVAVSGERVGLAQSRRQMELAIGIRPETILALAK